MLMWITTLKYYECQCSSLIITYKKESIICLTVDRIDNYVSGNRLKIKSGLEW